MRRSRALRPAAAALVIGMFIAAWAAGWLAMLPLAFAERHLAKRNDLNAIRWIERARSLNGEEGRIEFLRARIQRRFNDIDGMDRHLRKAVFHGLPPQRAERERALAAAQSGRVEEVSDLLQQWMGEPGEDVADIADALSLGLEAIGRMFETKVMLQVWIADCPGDPKPHVQIGRIAENEVRPEDAEEAYRIALDKNPDFPMALYAYAALLSERKRPAEAIPMLQRCVRIDPQLEPAANIVLARCYRLTGEREQALRLLQDLPTTPASHVETAHHRLGIPPEPGEVAYQLGLMDFDNQDFEQAIVHFRKAVRQAPDHFNAERMLGLSLQRVGQDREAEQVLDRVARKRKELDDLAPFIKRMHSDPRDYEARHRIGAMLLANGRHDRALFYLNSVLVDAPNHVATHRLLFDFYAANRESKPGYEMQANLHRRFLEASDQAVP